MFLLLLLCCSFLFANEDEQKPPPPYDPRLTLSAFYENHQKNFFEGDLLIPLIQSNHFILFGNVRGLNRKKKEFEWNVGLGTRFLFSNNTGLFGIYTFFDRKRTTENNFFNQFSFGLELRRQRFVVTSNVYLPFGKKSKRAVIFDRSMLIDAHLPTFHHIIFVEGREIALFGLDFESGFRLLKPLFFYVGGFYFNATHTPTLVGPKVRAELIYETKQNSFIPLSKLILEGAVSYDHVRNTKLYLGLRFSFDLGDTRQNKKRKGLQKWMTSTVRRDYDIVIEGNTKQTFELLKRGQTPILVKLANTLSELDQGLSLADVVAVQKDISLDAQKNLKPFQTLTSKDFIFGEHQSIILGPGNKTLSTNTQEMFTLTQNNTLRDLNLTVQNGDYLFKSNQNIHLLELNSIHSNGKIELLLNDGSNSSSLMMKNSHFELISSGTHILLDLAVSNNSQLSTLFENNTYILDTDQGTHIAHTMQNSGQINIHSMTANTFQCKKGTQNIAIQNTIMSTTNNGLATFRINAITQNQFDFFGNGDHTAILTKTDHATVDGSFSATFDIHSITNNHIHFHNTSFGNALSFTNMTTHLVNQNLHCQNLTNNQVIFENTHPNAVSIFVKNSSTKNQKITLGKEGGVYFNETHFLSDAQKTGAITLTNHLDASIEIFVNFNQKSLSKANFNAGVLIFGPNIHITP
ncbi:MAG: hypothetical protein K940chlam8_00615 [Chlamydiae bacterium]|nr:hypothetical protein [Chlamydiota bacterium]